VNLHERGLDVTRPMPVDLDGSKALRKAVLGRPLIQRCQLHIIRDVKDRLVDAAYRAGGMSPR
jgi:putative transposase